MTDEEFVRANWKALGDLWWDREYDENWISASDEKGQPIRLFRGRSTDAQAWAAAAELTRERLEQIRLIQEERAMLCGKLLLEDHDMAIMKRILVRLDSALADLRRGMKPEVA